MSQKKQLTRIENKVDILSNHLGDINTTLAGQHATLVEHIKRTEQNEKDIKIIYKTMFKALIGALTAVFTAFVAWKWHV